MALTARPAHTSSKRSTGTSVPAGTWTSPRRVGPERRPKPSMAPSRRLAARASPRQARWPPAELCARELEPPRPVPHLARATRPHRRHRAEVTLHRAQNSTNVSSADTGLPGRPRNRFSLARPTASGFPCRMATFQKARSMPASASARLHHVVIADAHSPYGDHGVRAGGGSRTYGSRRTSPPHARTHAVSAGPLLSTTLPGRSASPGSLHVAGREQRHRPGEMPCRRTSPALANSR